MRLLFVCLLAASFFLNACSTSKPRTPAPVSQAAGGTNTLTDPVERELKRLMEEDDASQAEVDKWIQDNIKFAKEGAAVPREELNARIRQRFAPVRSGYERFITEHTNHVAGLIAYASFLGELGEEEKQFGLLDRARILAPTNASVWNNIANYYGHNGVLDKAFDYYTKAIELEPTESVYYHNFGTTVFLFRKDAMEHYKINEQQVFDKALDLYDRAMKHDPKNFELATDVASTYYGIMPRRPDAALGAWTNAMRLASEEVERQGVQIHFARVKISAGRFDEARAHLSHVSDPTYADLKKRLNRNADEKESAAKNPPPPASQSEDKEAVPDPKK